MSRYEVIHDDKGLAFGNDHACGEFLMIWKRPAKGSKARRLQDQFGADSEDMLVDVDTMFDKEFTRPKMEALISEHGFRLEELERVKEGNQL